VDGKRMTLPEFARSDGRTGVLNLRRIAMSGEEMISRSGLRPGDGTGRPRRGGIGGQTSEQAGGKVGLDDFLVSESAWPLGDSGRALNV
jgi:hypothetical protein